MKSLTLKLTQEVADAMRARVKAFDPDTELAGMTYKDILEGTSEKARKIREDGGTFDVIISTEVMDRAGEIVKQDGWDLTNYKNNPIVLWGHDYYSLGIGVCLETYNTTFRGVPALGARGVFYTAEINVLAQQVRKMYEFGVKLGVGAGCTTSVGFIPKAFDANDKSVITASELLEFSFVPVPANQGVGPASGRALTIEEATTLGIDMFAMRAKGLEFTEKEQKASAIGDACEMPDGTPGLLAKDPKDEAAMVCVVSEQEKSVEGVAAPEISVEKWWLKGAVEEELHENDARKAKWAKVDNVYDVFGAFISAYLDDATPVEDFEKLLDEAVSLMKGTGTKGALLGEVKGMGADIKIGAALSAATKEKLKEAHGYATECMKTLKALHGGMDEKTPKDEPAVEDKEKGAAQDTSESEELSSFIATRDLARALAGSLHDMLAESNGSIRDLLQRSKK